MYEAGSDIYKQLKDWMVYEVANIKSIQAFLASKP
jgi:hypothetical protein